MSTLNERKFHEKFIHDLLNWIEHNLHQKLFINEIAKRAGYSPWHLQRLFKMITRASLGEYVRNRKLSMAALALRLTRSSIIDIANCYCFDSQQTFGRAFKKQFFITPAAYRMGSDWSLAGIYSPFQLQSSALTALDITMMPELHLIGKTEKYLSSIEHISTELTAIREKILYQQWVNCTQAPAEFYMLSRSEPDENRKYGLNVSYTVAAAPNDSSDPVLFDKSIIIEGGRYAKFSYQGNSSGLHDFIMAVYFLYLPQYRLLRRTGYDIEHYRFKSAYFTNEMTEVLLECDYLVPVR